MIRCAIAFCIQLAFLNLFVVTSASANEDVTLQLKWIHAFQFAGYYAAKEKGYYDEVGLNVTIKAADPHTNVPESVLTGEATFGVGTSSLLLERMAGKPVVVLAVIFQHSPLVLIAKETHSTQGIHDIVDKRVMIEPQSDELFAFLKRVGVPKERLIIQKHSFDPDDLMQGRTDVISAYVTNERFFLEKNNFSHQTYTPRSVGIDFYGDNLFTSESELSKHPERVAAFKAASLKGWRYAMEHPEELVEIILEKYPTKYSRDFLLFEAKEMVALLQPVLIELGYMNPGRWKHITETYQGLGMIPSDFSLDGFLYEKEGELDLTWLYQVLAITFAALMLVGGLAVYIFNINRNLDNALSESKSAQKLIWNQANLDPLTELPNRRMFKDRLSALMAESNESQTPLALLYLDLDRFKEVNDINGHGMGDVLLGIVAERLKGCVREEDLVARLGGDEFTVILPNVADKAVIEAVAEKILEVVAEPYQIKHEALYISASIGITLYPADAKNSDVLLQNADQAMYAAKAKGRNRYHYFTPDMQKNALHRVQLLNDMRNAVVNDEFELYYQPIVNLQTGKITKAEALIRWNHPTRGLVSPLDFIPLAEETGHIIEIGDWVFKTATNQLVSWQSTLDTKINISINTSPEQYIHSKQTTAKWFDYVESLGLDCNSLIMELTESTLMESGADVTDRLHAFRERGAKVALDDFGTGYSSLSYLHQFDIDFIKIDKSFVRNLKADSNDLILCEAMIIMAHKLGIKVIAEGVETDQQLALLDKAGCDYAQGYLFSKPVPVEAFEDLVSNWYLKAGGLDHLL